MKIKKITLKNYKRFQDLTIDLGEEPKRIVALVGPNGCGKSSVFDSMLFLMNQYNMIGNRDRRGYKYHSLKKEPNYHYNNINIEFTTGKFYEVYQQKQRLGNEGTIFSFRSSYRYNSDLNVMETRAVSEIRLNNYGASNASDIDDKMEQNYRRLLVKYNDYLNSTDCRPSEAKQHIIGELNHSLENCLDLRIDNIGDIQSGQGTIFFTKDDYNQPFEYNVLSAGEKEVVDILIDLFVRKEDYNDTIFIIDEPELHLNTSIQRKLLIEINHLIDPNCQIWVATHSIGFLRALQEELRDHSQIIEFKSNNKWAQDTYTLTPIKPNRNNWKSIFSTALDDLTNLVSPKTIVYCEGRDEPGNGGSERGFDAKVFNTIFNTKYTDIVFISSGGNTELDQRSDIAIKILTKVFTDIDILVLKDRDMASGNNTDENDRQIYLKTNPANHRVLKRWEIENYLYDYKVLEKYCVINNLTFDKLEYNNFVKDVINQNLKDSTGIIKNICGIKSSINAEKFKLSIAEVISDDLDVYKELEQVIFNRQ